MKHEIKILESKNECLEKELKTKDENFDRKNCEFEEQMNSSLSQLESMKTQKDTIIKDLQRTMVSVCSCWDHLKRTGVHVVLPL